MSCTRPDCPVCAANAPKRQDDARWTVGEASKDGLSVAFDSSLPSNAWIEPLCVLACSQEAQTLRQESIAEAEAKCGTRDAHHPGCPVFTGYPCACKGPPQGQDPVEPPPVANGVEFDLQQPREFPAPYTTPEVHIHHYCPGCQASKPRWHVHGDPLEDLVWGELLEKCRELIATAAKEPA